MELKEELISDTIDDAVGADEEDEERCVVLCKRMREKGMEGGRLVVRLGNLVFISSQ